MNIAEVSKKQTIPYNTYNTHCRHCNGNGCSAFKCSSFTSWKQCDSTNGVKDWQSGHKGCAATCPDKPICSKPNPDECSINGIKLKDVSWDKKSPLIKCRFNLSDFKTLDNVNEWKKKFVFSDRNPNTVQ